MRPTQNPDPFGRAGGTSFGVRAPVSPVGWPPARNAYPYVNREPTLMMRTGLRRRRPLASEHMIGDHWTHDFCRCPASERAGLDTVQTYPAALPSGCWKLKIRTVWMVSGCIHHRHKIANLIELAQKPFQKIQKAFLNRIKFGQFPYYSTKLGKDNSMTDGGIP